MFKSILCPIDLEEFTAGQLSFARSFARTQYARITALHVTQPPLEAYGHLPLTQLEENWDQVARERMAAYCDPDIETRIGRGSIASEIIRTAETGDFDLILMPTHGYRGFKKLFLGSVFQGVLSRTGCCVLALAPNLFTTETLEFRKPDCILCSIEVKKRSAKLIHIAARLSTEFQTKFIAMHSVEIPRELLSQVKAAELKEFEKRFTDQILKEEPYLTQADELILKKGPAYEQILECIGEKSAGLLVVGFSHHSPYSLRTTLYRTIADLTNPALCIPLD